MGEENKGFQSTAANFGTFLFVGCRDAQVPSARAMYLKWWHSWEWYEVN